MEKYIVLRHEEFKQELANVINRSGLPAFVVEYVLKDYLEETRRVVSMQYFEAQKQIEELEKQTASAEEKVEVDAADE